MQRLKTTSNQHHSLSPQHDEFKLTSPHFNIARLNFITPLMASISLLAGGLAFLQPFSFTDNSYADSSKVDISVTLAPTIGISTNVNKVDLDISASDFEDLVTGDVIVNVGTNNAYGYTLSVSAEGSETALVNKDNSNLKIPTLSNETTSTTWASDNNLNNTWGFTHNNTDILTTDTYLPMVASNTDGDTTVKVTSEPKNSSETKVTFATKIDKTQLSGDYSNKIIFSAIANSAPTLDDITYMQDTASNGKALCNASTEWTSENNKEYTLKDSRDNIEYKIRKLADGHCWMAQNFRMTADTLSANNHSATLTSTDTDINGSTANFVMPSNTSWSASYASAGNLLKGAMSADNPQAVIGYDKSTAASSEQAVAHGAYYSWCTATADCSADPGTNQKQPSSICPKGWRLADPSNGYPDNNNEYYKLYNSYGTNATFNEAFNTYYSKGTSYYLAGYWYAYSSDGQYVYGIGSLGYWWSNTSAYDDEAWDLEVNSNGTYSSRVYHERYYGVSIRCML